MEIIESGLTVIGAISLVIGIVRFIWMFCSSGSEWIDNIEIKVVDWDTNIDYEDYFVSKGNSVYPNVINLANDEPNEITVNYFIPSNMIIKRLKIKKIVDESIDSKRLRYKVIKTVCEITPQSPLCLIVERREAIPQYIIEWKTLYGGKASYCFYSNMRDGTYNKHGVQYTYGFWSRIRKYFGLI